MFACFLSAIYEKTQRAPSAGAAPVSSVRLVVESRTSAISAHLDVDDIASLEKRATRIQRSALSDLRLHIDDISPIDLSPASLPSAMKVDYLSPEARLAIFDEKLSLGQGWSNFYKSHPGVGGICAFSPVGFSADGKQAVFVSGVSCGGTCGIGLVVLMRRDRSAWVLEESQQLWIC